MADLCFICEKSLSEGDFVTVVRGLKTLKSASIERNDGHIDFLNNLTSVNVHIMCRKGYISKTCITASKRRLDEDETTPSTSAAYKKRNEAFDLKKLCLFCGQSADKAEEAKKAKGYRRAISEVSTLEFKGNIIKRAEERNDTLGELVKNRVLHEHDLIAAETKYHKVCYTNFWLPVTKKILCQERKIAQAMDEIFLYIENHDDSQFTLKELKDAISEYVPDDKTILAKLQGKYLKNIVITRKTGSFTIISFRDTHTNIISKSWYESKKSNPEEERLRIVEAAAAIVREDIRASVVETQSYPPPSKMFDEINEEIPKTLLHFLNEIILKNRKGRMDHLQTKCTSISHAIMASLRERSFSSQLLLGLSVFLHRRYGSKKLLNILSSLGFAASYSDTVQYEISTVYHPQPNILSSESGALVQYVGDNADINVQTLDGNNTLHVMGMIKIVTPKEGVIYDKRIQKCTSKPSAKELAAISHVALLSYEKPVEPGYSKIQVENLHDDLAQIEQKLNSADLLWLYGKWKNILPLPGWNGYLEQLTKNNRHFSTSRVIFLPFIDHPASNLDTIYTTVHCAMNIAKSHNQNTCVITFDQPLYSKAREMISASDPDSEISKTVVRLGGFHMLMSFLGSIGYIMDGSGLREALSNIYASNSVDKMLNGHAYARSIRGHTLLRLALSIIIFEDMKMEDLVFDELSERICFSNVSYEDIEGCVGDSNAFIGQFRDKLNLLKARGPTAQLWVEYFVMVSIALDFIRAERLGLFKEHLDAVRKMLPYFHASGHFLYAKSAHIYLQDMTKLKNTMDQQTFEQFKNGFFTIRRTEKFNSGTWTDMVIEQSLMKSMKAAGGVSRGRSTQESVLCKWVYTMYATNTICEEIERFCNISLNSVEEHVDIRDSRVKRDNNDVSKLVEWLRLRDPFTKTNQLVSLASGIIGDDQINCHKAHEIGIQSMMKITGLKFNEIKFKRADKVLPLSIINKSIKINNCKISVDPLLLFQRITVTKQFESNLEGYFQYELSPYPTSLFDNDGMRKTAKATFYDTMTPTDVELGDNNLTYVIDGGFLLHRVVWCKDEAFSVVLDKYVSYLQRHYTSKTVVVFDGYSDYSKNIKAMEQLRRTAVFSKTYEVSFNESMSVPISQDKFLSNRCNKIKLIDMLIKKLESVNITTKQANDDADVLIIETAIEESNKRIPVIIGEDIDLLVILIGRTQLLDKDIFFRKVGKGNVKTQLFSSKSLDKCPLFKKHILFFHAFSGCDTTSALFKKGKRTCLKSLQKLANFDQLAQVFLQKNCDVNKLYENGLRILLGVYNAPESEDNIDHLRYTRFIKSTKLCKPVQLCNLPPTNAAAHQHIKRVYYQVQKWLGHDLRPEEWGWVLQNEFLEPIKTVLPPAPEELLHSIFCNCKNGCGVRCGCRKSGLQCSLACGQCNGQACLNAASSQDDPEEESAFDPEVLDEMETIIHGNEDDDCEIEIFTRTEDDGDEEQEEN